MFLSPVVLALLHQDSLLGAECRPLDVPKLLETHVDAFLRSFEREKAPRRRSPRPPGGKGQGDGPNLALKERIRTTPRRPS
jgi:hypothetical protein